MFWIGMWAGLESELAAQVSPPGDTFETVFRLVIAERIGRVRIGRVRRVGWMCRVEI